MTEDPGRSGEISFLTPSDIQFGGIPAPYFDYDKARICILPVPYEGTVTYGRGTSGGPGAILQASTNMELWDEEMKANIFESGIHTFSPLGNCSTPLEMLERVYSSAKILVQDGKFVVLLGGEHSLTQGIVRAYYEKYPLVSVLQIDAHTDLRKEYDSSPLSHACAMRWIYDREIPLVQVGIRSTSEEERALYDKNRSNIFLASEIVNEHSARWMDEVVSRFSDSVYITLDVDGLDPSIMPSTGTPEPGGLGWYQVLALLRKVASRKTVVGFDIVELAPEKRNQAPDYLCARLLYKMLGYVFFRKDTSAQVSMD